MKNMNEKVKRFGASKPRDTKKNKLIGKAVKRAVYEYEEAYKRLAVE